MSSQLTKCSFSRCGCRVGRLKWAVFLVVGLRAIDLTVALLHLADPFARIPARNARVSSAFVLYTRISTLNPFNKYTPLQDFLIFQASKHALRMYLTKKKKTKLHAELNA